MGAILHLTGVIARMGPWQREDGQYGLIFEVNDAVLPPFAFWCLQTSRIIEPSEQNFAALLDCTVEFQFGAFILLLPVFDIY